ncbi:MAG: hypothetical protein ABSB49_18960 [Polyangia bacterium]|jgi:hypothetical protein
MRLWGTRVAVEATGFCIAGFRPVDFTSPEGKEQVPCNGRNPAAGGRAGKMAKPLGAGDV